MVAAFETVGECVKVSYAKLVFSGFFWFFFMNAMYLSFLFHSAFFLIWCCLADESAFAFSPLTISLRACLFDLICFDFLSGTTTVLHFLSGDPWEEFWCWSSVLSTSSASTASVYFRFASLNCIFTAVFFVTFTIIKFTSSCTNKVLFAEKLNRISKLVSVKTGFICLN